jgi:hypothetical protein
VGLCVDHHIGIVGTCNKEDRWDYQGADHMTSYYKSTWKHKADGVKKAKYAKEPCFSHKRIEFYLTRKSQFPSLNELPEHVKLGIIFLPKLAICEENNAP